MNWTSETPTRPGLYLYAYTDTPPAGYLPLVARVFVAITGRLCCRTPETFAYPVADIAGYWLGPIEPLEPTQEATA